MHKPTFLKESLLQTGLVQTVTSGLQFDMNVAFAQQPSGTQTEKSLCDHNCTSKVGGYDCPSAFSLNKGIRPKTMPPVDVVLGWIFTAIEGLRSARDHFIKHSFDEICERFEIFDPVKTAIRDAIRTDSVEVNLFGGNPEMYPHIFEVIRILKQSGHRVNFTTTGWKFMQQKDFSEKFLACPPHVLALSTDDFEPGVLEKLLPMSLEELKAARGSIPKDHGQAQKAVEAVYAAKLFRDDPPCTILFNMVVSKQNIFRVRNELIPQLEEAFPHAIVNPYPAQEAFAFGQHFFDTREFAEFQELIDYFIDRTLHTQRFVKRLHYWLLMKAASNSSQVAGYGIWRCYMPGSGRYLQAGRYLGALPASQTHPGGHLGCYWNPGTVTTIEQITTPEQVLNYLTHGMQNLAAQTLPKLRCPGCAMPRLVFDLMNLQAGMDPMLIPKFIALRRQYVGF